MTKKFAILVFLIHSGGVRGDECEDLCVNSGVCDTHEKTSKCTRGFCENISFVGEDIVYSNKGQKIPCAAQARPASPPLPSREHLGIMESFDDRIPVLDDYCPLLCRSGLLNCRPGQPAVACSEEGFCTNVLASIQDGFVLTPRPGDGQPLGPTFRKVRCDDDRIVGLLKTWRPWSSRAKGFYNLGNTCFANSLLQIMFHIPQVGTFLEYLSGWLNWIESTYRDRIEDFLTADEELRREFNFLHDFIRLFNRMIHPIPDYAIVGADGRTRDYKYMALIPREFLIYSWGVYVGAQEDSSEKLQALIERVDATSLSISTKLRLADVRGARMPPNLSDLFNILSIQKNRCQHCGTPTVMREPQKILLLTFPADLVNLYKDRIREGGEVRNPPPVGWEDLFASSFPETEPVDGYACGTCRTARPMTRQTELSGQGPPYLIVSLNRYAADTGPVINKQDPERIDWVFKAEKIKSRVDFPIRFDLATLPGSRATGYYRIIGVIFHIGSSPRGGHYKSAFLDFNNQPNWIYANDREVVRMSFDEFMAMEAERAQKGEIPYVFVYERIGHSGPRIPPRPDWPPVPVVEMSLAEFQRSDSAETDPKPEKPPAVSVEEMSTSLTSIGGAPSSLKQRAVHKAGSEGRMSLDEFLRSDSAETDPKPEKRPAANVAQLTPSNLEKKAIDKAAAHVEPPAHRRKPSPPQPRQQPSQPRRHPSPPSSSAGLRDSVALKGLLALGPKSLPRQVSAEVLSTSFGLDESARYAGPIIQLIFRSTAVRRFIESVSEKMNAICLDEEKDEETEEWCQAWSIIHHIFIGLNNKRSSGPYELPDDSDLFFDRSEEPHVNNVPSPWDWTDAFRILYYLVNGPEQLGLIDTSTFPVYPTSEKLDSTGDVGKNPMIFQAILDADYDQISKIDGYEITGLVLVNRTNSRYSVAFIADGVWYYDDQTRIVRIADPNELLRKNPKLLIRFITLEKME